MTPVNLRIGHPINVETADALRGLAVQKGRLESSKGEA